MTGARRNEIQAQRWEWIDWENSRVRLYTSKKLGGEERGRMVPGVVRAVPLWPQLREILEAYWRRQGRPSVGLVFPKLRAATRARRHALPVVERGGFVDKAVVRILGQRGLLKGGCGGEPLLFLGLPGYNLGFKEFRVTYCATRQTVEPVGGRPGEWVSVARRTVELKMGHSSWEMVERAYGRVTGGPRTRSTGVEYPVRHYEAIPLLAVGS